MRLLALALSAATAQAACKAVTLDFLLLDGNSVHAAIEDDIRADLAVIGIDVVSRAVDRETFNADMVAGNYDMVFSETWGAPYDPHSFVASWTTPDEAHYSALPTAGIDTTQFAADVADILSESDAEARQAKWTTLLSSIHDEVIHLPLFGRRIPSVSTSPGAARGPSPFSCSSKALNTLSQPPDLQEVVSCRSHAMQPA